MIILQILYLTHIISFLLSPANNQNIVAHLVELVAHSLRTTVLLSLSNDAGKSSVILLTEM